MPPLLALIASISARFATDSPLEEEGFEPSVPVSGLRFSRPCSLPAIGQAPAIAANGTSMTATERCCSASAFMDNTCSSTLKSWSPRCRPKSCRSTLRA
jgi:hypothetical protein